MSKSISNLFLVFIFIFTQTFVYADNYVCSTDQGYIDYKAGNALNLDGVTKYAGNGICENNCRSYTQCEVNDVNNNLYDCPTRKFENIGGDYENGTRFSSKTICNTKCYWQNSCVKLVDNPCKIVNIELSNPVTDYTGKTVYTTRKVTHECTNTQTKQAGCNKWKIIANNTSFDYNITDEATVWKSRTASDSARNTMAMLEQQLHIFSGWKGKCESGILWNNPFSDPMAILGYAMMLYSAAGAKSLTGTAIGKAHDAIKNTYDAAAKTVSDTYHNVAHAVGLGQSAKGIARDAFLNGHMGANAINTTKSLTNTLSGMNHITTLVSAKNVAIFSNDINLLWTDVAQLAMALVPNKKEIQQADFFNKAWMGNSDADQHALAYANCMASIGLSMPNMVSAYSADINNTSSELKNFWENPIRLTPEQLAILVSATSEDYAQQAYVEYDYAPDEKALTLIAKDKSAYYQAGQVICGGKLAIAQNILQQSAVDNGGSSGSGSGIAVGVGKMVLSKIATAIGGPIAGLVVSLVIDIVTSFESGDACHDKDIAVKWGIDQLKTNQALNFDQCHHTKDECAAKWFWGSCMRTRHKYCCYDQISTRIFAEGLKEQMFPATDPQTGLPNSHIWDNCSISINDLKNISFRKCTADEQPYADHCFPADKYDEFVEAINKSGVVNFDFEGAANQAINSLAIPNKVCHNNQ